MTWTAPITFYPGMMMLAAILNEQVRDNLNETAPAKVTTAGDLVYASGPHAIARLAMASKAYKLLRANAAETAPEWAGIGLRQAPLYQSTGGNMSTSYADAVSKSITTSGGSVLIIANLTSVEAKSASAAHVHDVRFRRDTTDLLTATLSDYTQGAVTQTQHWPIVYVDSPAAGTYDYNIEAKYTSSSTSGTPTAEGRIALLEIG